MSKYPGHHVLPCGEKFPLNDPVDSLIILIHQEFCVIDQAAYIAAVAELQEGE